MPTYDYICENCGYEFDRFQSITAAPLRKCTKCNKRTLKRLIGTGSGIIFKGSGFYQTDYRSESYQSGQKKEKTSADKNTSKKKTEAKPKAKDSTHSEKTKSDPTPKKKTK